MTEALFYDFSDILNFVLIIIIIFIEPINFLRNIFKNTDVKLIK